jgi:hypothetical protein
MSSRSIKKCSHQAPDKQRSSEKQQEKPEESVFKRFIDIVKYKKNKLSTNSQATEMNEEFETATDKFNR